MTVALSIVCFLLLAAHWLRSDNLLLVVLTLALIPLAFVRRRWACWTLCGVLVLAALEWATTGLGIAQSRAADGTPWARALVILGAVAAVNLLAA